MARNSISAYKALEGASQQGVFCFGILMLMELVPDTQNVVYIDEYPELKKRVWLRRLAQERLGSDAVAVTAILPFERPEPPDDAA